MPCLYSCGKTILCLAFIPALPSFLRQGEFLLCLYFCHEFFQQQDNFFYLTFICDLPSFLVTRWFFASALPSFLRWGGFVICLYFCLAFFQQQKKFKSKKILNLKKVVKGTSRQPIITAQGEVAMAWQQILQKVQKCSLFHEFWVVWDILGYFLKLDKKEKGSSRQLIVMAWREVAMTRQKKNCKKCRNTDYFTSSELFGMFLDIFWSWIKKEKSSGRQPIITAWQEVAVARQQILQK